MVKITGGRAGSVSRLKKEMERSAGGRTWVRGVKAGEDLTVRFLTEPDDWYAYREHYDPEVNFFPCIGRDNDCPGCNSDSEKTQRASKRFLANAFVTEEAVVVPLKLTLDLANRLVARYERYGDTIMDRDYTLHRMGKGLDTTYDVTPEERSNFDHTKYDLIDLEQVLIEQFEDSFDSTGETSARSEKKSIDTEPDVDDEVPSEPSSSADEDDDDGYLTEEQALKMPKEELKRLAEQVGVEIDGRWSQQKMVDAIFSQAE